MILLGFFVFALGILFLTYGSNDRIGFGLGLTGFTLVLLGVVGGNWIASRSPSVGGYGAVHRVAIVGFCVAIAGIVLEEFLPSVGVIVMVGGLCTMFIGFIVAVIRINRTNTKTGG
jgi:hypothetical protein